MKAVLLKMTTDQAAVNARALNLFARLHLGQFNLVAEMFREGRVPGRDPNTAYGGRVLTVAEMQRAELLCDELKRILGFERGGSFGIGSKAVAKDAHRSYEVLSVLQQALAVDRDPSGNGQLHAGLRLRYTEDPLPEATVTDTAADSDAERATRDVLDEWATQQGVSFVNRSSGEYTTKPISLDQLLELVRSASAGVKG
jgi:hypothetical protein